MSDDILLNIESKEIRYAHLKNGQLTDLILERKSTLPMTGNVYRGRVTNILHNIQSAFIDIGEEENGFIHISDILENTKKFENLFEMDFDLDYDIQTVDVRKQEKLDIEEVLKVEQPVLVQVVKEPIGTKGARLTSSLSIPGRYLVLLPNSPHRGVSRRIEAKSARERLKKLIRTFSMPNDMGLICRTASVHATTEMLIDEANDLLHTWETIVEGFNQAEKPKLLHEESDIIKRAVMKALDKKYDRLLVDDYATYQRCKNIYVKHKSEHIVRIEYYRDKTPIFERFNVEREIERCLQRKIWLPSGGYLFFEQTEAMFTIDVNSGRGPLAKNTADVEESLVKLNLEAAEEIARQLRIRNVGGLVICDFVDMRFRKNQKRVADRLKECMKEDHARCTILSMSEFGLIELTRQRNRESLMQTLFVNCPYCSGLGKIKSHESVTIELARALKKAIHLQEQFGIEVQIHPSLSQYMDEENDKKTLIELAKHDHAKVAFIDSDELHINEFVLISTITKKKIE